MDKKTYDSIMNTIRYAVKDAQQKIHNEFGIKTHIEVDWETVERVGEIKFGAGDWKELIGSVTVRGPEDSSMDLSTVDNNSDNIDSEFETPQDVERSKSELENYLKDEKPREKKGSSIDLAGGENNSDNIDSEFKTPQDVERSRRELEKFLN